MDTDRNEGRQAHVCFQCNFSLSYHLPLWRERKLFVKQEKKNLSSQHRGKQSPTAYSFKKNQKKKTSVVPWSHAWKQCEHVLRVTYYSFKTLKLMLRLAGVRRAERSEELTVCIDLPHSSLLWQIQVITGQPAPDWGPEVNSSPLKLLPCTSDTLAWKRSPSKQEGNQGIALQGSGIQWPKGGSKHQLSPTSCSRVLNGLTVPDEDSWGGSGGQADNHEPSSHLESSS